MAFEKNDKYNTEWVTAGSRFFVKDPWGNDFLIFQGQQFKFVGTQVPDEQSGCASCNKEDTYYAINAYAHCSEGVYLWENGTAVLVDARKFTRTDQLILPPVTENWQEEISGMRRRSDLPPHLSPKEETDPFWHFNADLADDTPLEERGE